MNAQATSQRRAAIRRAARAVVLLHIDPTATGEARRYSAVVNDVELYGDPEAWECVLALECMVTSRRLDVDQPQEHLPPGSTWADRGQGINTADREPPRDAPRQRTQQSTN